MLATSCVHRVYNMASCSTTSALSDDSVNTSFIFSSFIRGFHVFKDRWDPQIGEILRVDHERNNSEDKNAIAIYKQKQIVGHAPREFARVMRFFLKRGGQISVEVKGKRVNRGLGFGLEIPANFIFNGNVSDTSKLKSLLKKEA